MKTIAMVFLASVSIHAATNSPVVVDFESSNDVTNRFRDVGEFQRSSNVGFRGSYGIVPGVHTKSQPWLLEWFWFESTEVSAALLFRFDDSIFNPNSLETTADIALDPGGNRAGGYVAAAIRRRVSNANPMGLETRFEIVTSSPIQIPGSIPIHLENGWYRLRIRVAHIGGKFDDQIAVSSELEKVVWVNGNPTFSSHATLAADVYDHRMLPLKDDRDALVVSFSGSQWGGCAVIDNLSISGVSVDDQEAQPQNKEFPPARLSKDGALSWESKLGRSYQIEESAEIHPPQWSTSSTPIVGVGGQMSHFIRTRDCDRGFYRVREE